MPPVRRSTRSKPSQDIKPAQKLAEKLIEIKRTRKRRKTKSDDSLQDFDIQSSLKENCYTTPKTSSKKSEDKKTPEKHAKYEIISAEDMQFNENNALAMLMEFETSEKVEVMEMESSENEEKSVIECDDQEESSEEWENVKEDEESEVKKSAKRKTTAKKPRYNSREESDFEEEQPLRKRKKIEPKTKAQKPEKTVKESTQTQHEKVVENFMKKCMLERDVCLEQCYLTIYLVHMKKVMKTTYQACLQGMFLSILPSCFDIPLVDVGLLQELLTWYRTTFCLLTIINPDKSKLLQIQSLDLFSKRQTSSQCIYILGFQFVAKLLGFKTRLITSINVLSLVKLKVKSITPKAKLKLLNHSDLKYTDLVDNTVDHWMECEIGNNFISVDVCNGVFDCDRFIESNATQPLGYVIAIFENCDIVDITPKYVYKWASSHRKMRQNNLVFWDELVKNLPAVDPATVQEHYDLMKKMMVDRGFPTTLTGFKHNLVFALEQNILKVEGLYPKKPPILGLFKGFSIYSTDNIKTLKQEIVIKKEGRSIIDGEDPWKIVQQKIMYDRYPGDDRWKDVALYGDWQTELYKPPAVVNWVVPRNEFGNVEMFQPWMLPIGSAHVDLPGSYAVARKLGIDAAHAVIGFEFTKRRCIPVMSGVIVCKESEDVLRDAWEIHSANMLLKNEEKRVKKCYDNWKLLIRGLLIKERLTRSFGENSGIRKGHVHKFSKKATKDKITGERVKKCSCGLIVPVEEEEEL